MELAIRHGRPQVTATTYKRTAKMTASQDDPKPVSEKEISETRSWGTGVKKTASRNRKPLSGRCIPENGFRKAVSRFQESGFRKPISRNFRISVSKNRGSETGFRKTVSESGFEKPDTKNLYRKLISGNKWKPVSELFPKHMVLLSRNIITKCSRLCTGQQKVEYEHIIEVKYYRTKHKTTKRQKQNIWDKPS